MWAFKAFSRAGNAKQTISGFTLIELIIAIMLMGILAVSLGSITTNSVYNYIDAKDRNKLSQSAKWITERVSREIREALPQSVRTNSSGGIHCVEFMNIVNASTALDIAASGSISSFNAIAFDLSFSSGLLVAIMPIDANSIYSITGVLASVASIATTGNQSLITLSSPTQFSRRSPQNRFYLLASPVSFCLNDNTGHLNRYSGYSLNSSQQFPPSGGNDSLMGENFSANGTVFNYQLGTLSRAGLLQMNFQLQNRDRNLSGNSESFEVFHEVHIRNVP